MEEFWNRNTIPAPATISLLYNLKKKDELRKSYDVILDVIEKSIEILSEDSCLASEMYILGRILYRLQNQMKREKNFQALKQIQKCINNFNGLKLKGIFQNFKECIYSGSNANEVHLPSKHMFQYLLTRMMGAVRVLIQASSQCERCYIHSLQRLHPGHFILKNLMFCGLTARIWVLTRALALQLSNLYKQLHDQLINIHNQPTQWLPTGVDIPKTLDKWVEKICDPSKLPSSTRTNVENMDIDDIIDRMEKKFGEDSKKEETPLNEATQKNSKLNLHLLPENTDLGVAISRKMAERGAVKVKGNKRKKDMQIHMTHVKPAKVTKSSKTDVTNKSKKKTQKTVKR
ncbi:nucleolus and neural progenitor protein-like [Tubulanus polymorphus]|uniref:nucleolus and neural progenitor protein-like n=1 Tax=Tubulanus polymorphus TaxID=672921 RepID=UPI003DA57D20